MKMKKNRVAKKKSVHSAAATVPDRLNDESNSLMFWGLLVFTVLFVFWTPYYRALFNGHTADFEGPIYSALVWGMVALFTLAIYLFYRWRLRDVRDVLMLFVWLIPITYFISLIPAESSYLSRNLLYIQILQVLFFLIGAEFARNRRAIGMITFGIIGTSFLIMIFGILHWFGSAGWIMKGFVEPGAEPIYNNAVMKDSNGYRLTSVFQYANTYAAYLIAMLFSSVFLLLQSRRWYAIIFHAGVLVPILLSFMLTLSRGAIVIIPVILIIILLFLPLYRQLLLMLYLVVAGVATLLILEPTTTIGQQIQQGLEASRGTGWALLLGASLATAGIIWGIQYYVAPKLKKFTETRFKFRFVSIVLPVVIVALGTIGATLLFTDSGVVNLLPDNIKKRVENINFAQHSVLERGTFYKDSLKLVKDYPILGAGGGAWTALYEKYQNNPYLSRQAHSYFFQYVTEVGFVGLLVLTIFLFAIFYYYIRHYIHSSPEVRGKHFVFFIFAVSLLIHSAIDFDMSYVYITSVVFLCLGSLIAPVQVHDKFLKHLTKSENGHKRLRKVYPAVVGIIAIIVFIMGVRLIGGHNAFLQGFHAAQKERPFPEIMEKLDRSLKLATNHPDYTLFTVSLLHQAYDQTRDKKYYDQAVDAIQSLRKAEPYNRGAVEFEFNQLLIDNQYVEGLELLERETLNFPWYLDFYEHRINLNFQLGNQARLENNIQTMDLYWDAAFEIYDSVLQRIRHLDTLPDEQLQGQEFEVTPNIALPLGQIEYIRGNYDKSAEILKLGIRKTLEESADVLIARWYLAALGKQGKEDKALYNKLIAQDPNEAVQIENLLKTTATN